VAALQHRQARPRRYTPAPRRRTCNCREWFADPSIGLTAADVADRRASARLDAAAAVPSWRKMLAQFANPLIYLLLGAVVVSVIAWIFEGVKGVSTPLPSLMTSPPHTHASVGGRW
jgi:magnesium-transporting ATPase (P-type)